MKEVEIFENWADRLVEGTWSLPETPEQMDKLKTMMTKELIVGPDATNATEQLYDLVGDDILFDRLSELAARDPRANAWNDTEVMDRLRELGIETPEQAPAGVQEPTAPAGQPQPAAVPQQPGVAEGTESQSDYDARMRRLAAQYDTMSDDKKASLGKIPGRAEQFQQAVDYVKKHSKNNQPGVAEGLKDVVQKVGAAAKKVGGAVLDRIAPGDEELLRDLQRRAGVPQHAQHGKASMAKSNRSVDEGQCNMTAEGQFCPEHGLAECAMEESQAFGPAATAAISQGKDPTEVAYAALNDKTLGYGPDKMKESDDPMNARHAVTDSFYESEIDRIKKLALSK